MERLYEHHLATMVKRIKEWIVGDIKNKYQLTAQSDVGMDRIELTAGDYRIKFGEVCEKDSPDWCELLVVDDNDYFLFGILFTNTDIDFVKYREDPDWCIISTYGDGKDIGADQGFTIRGEYNANPNEKGIYVETSELDSVLDYIEKEIHTRILAGSPIKNAEIESERAEQQAQEKSHLDGLEGLAGHVDASSQWGSGRYSREVCRIVYNQYYNDSLKGVETDYEALLKLVTAQEKKEDEEDE